jgi:hypothetical protein
MSSNNANLSNPSDYEFLIKTITEGNINAKAESLKRLNSLITTDKKQFATYAKRIVVSIQDLLTETKVSSLLIVGRHQFTRMHYFTRNN